MASSSIKTDFFHTPEGRFAYCFLDTPRTKDPAGKPLERPKYETAFYIPKTNPDPRQCRVYTFLSAKVMEVVQLAFRGTWPMRNWDNWPIHDCDADPKELANAPWGRGCWRVRLSGGDIRPRVVDIGNNDIPLDIAGSFRGFKSGDYGIASINC